MLSSRYSTFHVSKAYNKNGILAKYSTYCKTDFNFFLSLSIDGQLQFQESRLKSFDMFWINDLDDVGTKEPHCINIINSLAEPPGCQCLFTVLSSDLHNNPNSKSIRSLEIVQYSTYNIWLPRHIGTSETK